MKTLALFTNLGHWELLIILAIGLLLFGKRLPEVGRSLGKGIVEFKKGVKGIEEEIDSESDRKPSSLPPSEQPTAPDAKVAHQSQSSGGNA